MKAPDEVRTARLLLKKPRPEDAERVFQRYSGDESVGKYLAWPIHKTIEDTRAFIRFSESEWERWPAGPYLLWSLFDRKLIGSTGLAFETPQHASTGYVIARDCWGAGYATESVEAIQRVAEELGVRKLSACCHPDHVGSRRVLEKCGFALEGSLPRYCEFPNLSPGTPLDVLRYSWIPHTADGG